MSAIKNYIANLAVLYSRAYIEEGIPFKNNTYGCHAHSTYSDECDYAMEFLFKGKADDVFESLYDYLSDAEINEIMIRMPQTLMVCAMLIPFLSDEFRENYDLPKTEAEFIAEILS